MQYHSSLKDTDLMGRGGAGLKPEHYRQVIETLPEIGFFEVHAENYMGAGGPSHRYLEEVRGHYPISLHGVGLSIGGHQPLSLQHLSRLKELIRRYSPRFFSEHLAWSSHKNAFFNDLLPLPYTADTLAKVVRNINQVQDTLQRQMLLENPSTYLRFEESTYSEVDFIREVRKRTGCGLLLDVNNVLISATNLHGDAGQYIREFPLEYVQEIHLAGHNKEVDEHGDPLLIDTHDRPVEDAVWELYRTVIALNGPLATLIEWDTEIPSWEVLHREALQAESVMREFETCEVLCGAERA